MTYKKIIILLFFLFCTSNGFSVELVDVQIEKDKLTKLDLEKKNFLKKISIKEKICLRKFFSSSCMEKLEIEYLKGLRRYNLKRQEILSIIKRNESKKRMIRRESNKKRAKDRRQRN